MQSQTGSKSINKQLKTQKYFSMQSQTSSKSINKQL
jgi:hypothetical protein